MKSLSIVRKSLFVAVLGLMLTVFSNANRGNSSVADAATPATGGSCDRCIKAVQNSQEVCNFLIKVCGVQWFVDPCEFSPGALCACATGCDPNS